MAKKVEAYSDVNKVSFKKLFVGELYTTHLGVRVFNGTIDNYKTPDGKTRKVWVFLPQPGEKGRRLLYNFDDVTNGGLVLKALMPGMLCDYKGYVYVYRGYVDGAFLFETTARTGEVKSVTVPYWVMQRGTLVIDKEPAEARVLANLDDEAKDYQYIDFGEKVEGARKDLYDVKISEIKRMEGYVRDQIINKKGIIGSGTDAFWQEYYDQVGDRRLVALAKRIYTRIPGAPVYPVDDKTGASLTAAEKWPHQERYIKYCRKIWNKVTSYSSYDKFRSSQWLRFIEREGWAKFSTKQGKKVFRIEEINQDYVNYVPDVRGLVRCATYMAGYPKGKEKIDKYIIKNKILYTKEDKILQNYVIYRYDNWPMEFYTQKDGNGGEILHMVISCDYKGERETFGYTLEGDLEVISEDIACGDLWFVATDKKMLAVNLPDRATAEQIALEHYASQAKDKKPGARKKAAFKVEPITKELRIMNGTEIPLSKVKPITTEKFQKDFHMKGGEYGNWEPNNERQDNTTLAYWALSDLAKALGVPRKRVTFRNKLYLGFGSRGVANAMAHFEPQTNAINLTRMKGAGTLGHEWFHAFDYIVGQKLGYSSLSRVYDANPDKLPEPIRRAFDSIKYRLDKNCNVVKNEEGNPISSNMQLSSMMADDAFYALGLGYWSSTVEMFARSGHCYLYEKLKAMDCQNDYLTGTYELSFEYPQYCIPRVYLIPMDLERERMVKCFDDMFAYVKDNKLF